MTISAEQSIKARAALHWTIADLHNASGVSAKAIEEFETKGRQLNSTTLQGLLSAFESAGIEFAGDRVIAYSPRLRGITVDPRKQGRQHELE
jgi:hypothetical protein